MNGREVTSFGVGPISLDIEMARRHGWSETLIKRTQEFIGAIARDANRETHFNGPVDGCPCCVCDASTPTDKLIDCDGYLDTRLNWERRGLWGPQ